jgi:hypothetical protein
LRFGYDGDCAVRHEQAAIPRRERTQALTTESAITFIVEYDCARCGAKLEAKSSQDDGWVRCPQCGRAGLPPPYMKAPGPRPRVRAPLGDDVLVIGPIPQGVARSGRSGFGPGSVRRISAASALFLMLLTACLMLFHQYQHDAWIFGLLALGAACLAVFSPSGRR